uniref:Uncharacterized protein n=1 Tax=Brassica oleracea TaxID=3712 RepID=A0A3P6FMD6_BRAOL|nr:unnamed protein product [Brassica oleracea]
MIGQPMIPHSFNIHHPSQAIPRTHTGQRQAYINQIHTKPNLEKELSTERGPQYSRVTARQPQYSQATAGCYKTIAAYSTFGSPRDSPQSFGLLPVITLSCNHSAIGHDPVSLSALDPANKGFP